MLEECCEWVMISHMMMCLWVWTCMSDRENWSNFFLFVCFVHHTGAHSIWDKEHQPRLLWFCFIIPSDSTCVCIILHKVGDEVIAHAGYHTLSFPAFPPFAFSSVKQSALWKEGACSQPCLPCPAHTNSTKYTLAHHTQGQAQTT